MSTSLKLLLTSREIQILTDKYVHKLSHDELLSKHGEYEGDIAKVKLITIYEERQFQHNLQRKQILFDEAQLIRRIWREFLSKEVAKGKTSLQISQETQTSLETVNSYF